MDIEYTKGNLEKGDRILLITTAEKEPITIFKLGLLINQFAINECILKKEFLQRGDSLFFESFISDCIKQALAGVDFADQKNVNVVIDLCAKYHLPKERIDYKLLERVTQAKLKQCR